MLWKHHKKTLFCYSGLSLYSTTKMNLILVEIPGCELSVFLLTVSVFSTTRSLCLRSQCCAITLEMNHLPLWAHCFWPNYLPHQRWSYTSPKPRLNRCHLCHCRHSLSLHSVPLSGFKMDRSPRWGTTNPTPIFWTGTQKKKTEQCRSESLLYR